MSKSSTLQRLFKTLFFISFLFITFSNAFALDSFPSTTNFNSSSNGGFDIDDGDSNELLLGTSNSSTKTRTSSKTFDFGSSNSNTQVSVMFDVVSSSGWESSGGSQDYFEVYLNSSLVYRTSYSGSSSESKTFSTTTDATGKLLVKFKKITTATDETIKIDDLVISALGPVIQTDLAINSFTDTPDPTFTSENLTYTFQISNSGAEASGVSLTLSLSNGTYASVSSGWSCSGTTNITCTKSANMSDGASETLIIVATAPATPQTLSAQAILSSSVSDSNSANNSASASTTIESIVQNADDICFVAPVSISGAYSYNGSIGINNMSGVNLTNAEIFVDTSSLSAPASACSTDKGSPNSNCSNQSNYSIGTTTFSQGTLYALGDSLKSNDTNHSVEQYATINMNTISNIYAYYQKNGIKYRGKLKTCGDNTPTNFTCAYPKDFTSVFSDNLYGRLLLIGNTNLCSDNDSNGVCENPGNSTNNDIKMIYKDYDDTDGTSDNAATTSNSSAAYLDIPSGKTVVFAALLWQGYMVNQTETQKNLGKAIKYKHESDIYQSESNAKMNWVYFDSSRMYYQGYKEITSYVNQHGSGYYWVGDIATTQGQPAGGSFGGWSLAVIYEDEDTQEFRNIALFHGYQAFAGSTDISNASSYASSHGCDTTKTGVGNSVSSTLSGFLTPKNNEVNATLTVFSGEGDIGITGDSGYLTDSLGVAHSLSNTLNPTSNIMNATISLNDTTVTTGKPYYSANSLGIDIDTFDVSGILDNKQSSTEIKFNTSGDGYMPGFYGLQTQLYIPEFCYDYAYRQHDIYFTELNDGTKDPSIVGNVTTGDPIEVGLYIKNKIESDITVNNFYLTVDINDSQASYIRQTTQLTPINEIIPEDISDAYMSVADSYIKNIPVGNIISQGYFYTYYQLNPKVTSLDIPLNVEATYDLTIAGVTIPYNLKLGKKIGLCTDNNFRYQPAKSIFNMVHKNYYTLDDGGLEKYYNLPTQVVNRPGNFKIIALDPNALDTLVNTSTVVAVDMVDLSAFHDTNASCQQLSSAISPRVWIPFNNINSVSFDKTAIQTAISNGQTSITDPNAFYANARPHATFRITFNTTNDGNDDLVQTEVTPSGDYKILNFTQLIQDLGQCSQTVINPQSGNPTNQIAVACGNAGNAGVSIEQLTACMECIYGFNTKFICSRDNFAVRPEAFNIAMYDQNQTNMAQKTPLSNAAALDIASGYQYHTEINATTHTSSTNAPGYTYTLDESLNVFGFTWQPRSPITASACNDTNNSYSSVKFSNGYLETNTSLNEVGEYKYQILDKTYTSVDSNPAYMSHHTGSYFINASTPDCVAGSSIVKSDNPYPSSNVLNGCYISSEHNNTDYTDLKYKSYTLTLHPYKFDPSTISQTVGTEHSAIDTQSFVYMENVSLENNMSFHLNGSIKAVGYNNSQLSNFVDACYAKPVDINIAKSAISGNMAYRTRLKTYDNNTVVIRSSTQDLNNTTDLLPINTTDFPQPLKGIVNTSLDMNFQRDITTARNPESIIFTKYNAKCSTPADCTFNADLINNKTTQGVKNLNNTTIKHYYGRSHASRQIFTGPTGTDFIYYEVFCDGAGCDKTLLQNATDSNSTDDPRWFINTNHTNPFGTAAAVSQKGVIHNVTGTNATGNHQDSTVLTYDELRGYPYKATMLNTPSSWLLYNKYNNTATTNEFEVEFYNANSSWAGVHETNTTTENNGSSITNRRTMW